MTWFQNDDLVILKQSLGKNYPIWSKNGDNNNIVAFLLPFSIALSCFLKMINKFIIKFIYLCI